MRVVYAFFKWGKRPIFFININKVIHPKSTNQATRLSNQHPLIIIIEKRNGSHNHTWPLQLCVLLETKWFEFYYIDKTMTEVTKTLILVYKFFFVLWWKGNFSPWISIKFSAIEGHHGHWVGKCFWSFDLKCLQWSLRPSLGT